MNSKKFITNLIFCLLSTTTMHAQTSPQIPPSWIDDPNDPVQIIVNNRVLAKVNGQAITVLDLMKKMDVVFFRQFPEYTTIKAARHQFYLANWKYILQDLIDKELILADAKENKMPITSGDVRQELEDLFGPNIIQNLDKIGLSMDEAKKMVENDIIIRRMIGFRVNSKAIRQVNPQDIKNAYEIFARENVRPDEWVYQIISVKDKDAVTSKEAADYIANALNSGLSIENLENNLKGKIPASVNVSVSSEYQHKEKEISDAYKESLMPLAPGFYSSPSLQKSRNDKVTLYRIFFLKEKIPGGLIPFNEVAEQLKQSLIQKAMDKETAAYLKKLREHFGVNEAQLKGMIPADFEPFTLQTKKT